MRVTFDSNVWQKVVVPEKFPADPRASDLLEINDALRDGRVHGFISETVATLEAIRKIDRGTYFSGASPKVGSTVRAHTHTARLSMTVGPDDSLHPGLMPVLSDRLSAAVAMGMRLLPAPRIGMPRPPSFTDALGNPDPGKFATRDDYLPAGYNDAYAAVGRQIEKRGVGRAVVEEVAAGIAKRIGGASLPWFAYLEKAQGPVEEKAVEKGVAEWADGDAVASHIASGNEYFCTHDMGKSASVSVFDPTNRAWLEQEFNIRLVDVPDLAALIQSSAPPQATEAGNSPPGTEV